MLNFGKACRVFVSPAVFQVSIATANGINTMWANEGGPKQLVGMFDVLSRLRFAAMQSTDPPMDCDNSSS
jgi:hypothetical protein